MPLGGPPPGTGSWPDPITFTSEPGVNTIGPACKTLGTLRQIDQVLMSKAVRWETLKRIRVMRLARLGDPMDRDAQLKKLPKSYAPYFLNPRLSTVLVGANVANIANLPEHLDLDWFGKAYQNWWPGNVSGENFEDLVATQAQWMLENAFNIGNSASADPSAWDWGAGAKDFGDFGQDLTFQAPPAGAAGRPVGLRITWEISAAFGDPDCFIDPANPTHLVIRSKLPKDPAGIELP